MSANDAYRFTIKDQQVVAVQEWDDGRWEHEGIDHDESYQVSGNQVVKTEWDDGRQEITTYQDADGDGVYQKVSKSYAPANSGTSSSAYDHYDDDDHYGYDDDHYYSSAYSDSRYDSDNSYNDDNDYYNDNNYASDDWLSFSNANDVLLTNMALQSGTDAADRFIVADSGLFTVLDFNAQQGDRLVFDTGMGMNSYMDLAATLTGLSYQGDTLQLSFGNNTQISLTGIAASDISWNLIEVIS